MPNNSLSRHWDALNQSAIRWKGWIPTNSHRNIANYFDKTIDGRNLDLCCGFYPHVTNSIGLDISAFALEQNQYIGKEINRPQQETLLYNLNDLEISPLPFKDNSFESATLVSGWNYIDPIEKLIDEVKRVLVPDSYFYVVQYVGNAIDNDFQYVVNVWDEFAVRMDTPVNIHAKLFRLGYETTTEEIDNETEVVIAKL